MDPSDVPEMHDPPEYSILPVSLTISVQSRWSDISARHWNNRFLAWQARERCQKEERERLRQDQRRIFGGDSQDSGEDGDRLCSSMLAFFDGLDYLKEDPSFLAP